VVGKWRRRKKRGSGAGEAPLITTGRQLPWRARLGVSAGRPPFPSSLAARNAARRGGAGGRADSGDPGAAGPPRPDRRGASCHPVPVTCAWATVAAERGRCGAGALAGRAGGGWAGWPTKKPGRAVSLVEERPCAVSCRRLRTGVASPGWMSGRARGAPHGGGSRTPVMSRRNVRWIGYSGGWVASVHGSMLHRRRLCQLCGQDPGGSCSQACLCSCSVLHLYARCGLHRP
jgi:hypothetical protein